MTWESDNLLGCLNDWEFEPQVHHTAMHLTLSAQDVMFIDGPNALTQNPNKLYCTIVNVDTDQA